MINTAELSLQELLSKEVLETNGLGGYCSLSLAGANTRKYHGILVASFNPPVGRKVLVSKVEERVKVDEEVFDLSVNQYPGIFHPIGHQYLQSFERKPIAQWNYGGTDWQLEKKMAMVQGSNTTILSYQNSGKKSITIELHPLFTDTPFHDNSKENNFDFYYESLKSGIKVHAYQDSNPIFFSWSKGEFVEHRSWYKNTYLYQEAYRGIDPIEDYYRIGYLKTELKPGQSIHIHFSTEEKMAKKKGNTLLKKTIENKKIKKIRGVKDEYYYDLLQSGQQFLVHRASTNSSSIIAGYHWFNDWGRDTMIAMRGLTIATGEKEVSKSILNTFLKYLDEGMLPNNFPDNSEQEIEYNTIDASLWLFVAVYDYYLKFNDHKFVTEHIDKLEQIIQKHIEGTRYNIKLTEEGFIYGGEDGYQLTWMDARVDGYVVTPRVGCPVEITALWYNALKIHQFLSDAIKHDSPIKTASLIKKVEKNFKKYYLNEEGYLNDVVNPNSPPDTSFRCNQLYAISLPFTLLNNTQSKKIVKLVTEKLFTDYGIRSLEVDDSSFRDIYEGDQWSRDTAYHQGTVWGFVMGEYIEAFLKVNNYKDSAKKKVKNMLEPLQEHFYKEDCIHGVSEIFDGLEPKTGRGCINQAWSVSALIKIYTDHELYKY